MFDFIRFNDSLLNVGMMMSVVKNEYNYHGDEGYGRYYFIEVFYSTEKDKRESFKYTTAEARDLDFEKLAQLLCVDIPEEGVNAEDSKAE